MRGIDAISVSFHKLYGPTGIGALVVSPRMAAIVKLAPQIFGSQNGQMRGGTENIAAIAGANEAMRITWRDRDQKNQHLLNMKGTIVNNLSQYFNIGLYENYAGKPELHEATPRASANWPGEIVFLGPVQADGTPHQMAAINTISVSFVKYGSLQNHFCNMKLRNDLLQKNCIISLGSACNSSSSAPNSVLMAIRAPYIIRCGVIRISLGDYNTMDECSNF
jgi:cysteine sulfinate desulfinase/cysteine desulfurase-like protein